jgi:hypothetical protein
MILQCLAKGIVLSSTSPNWRTTLNPFRKVRCMWAQDLFYLTDRSHNHKLICSQQTHGIRINYSSAGHYDLQGDQKKITSEISGTFRSTKHLLHCFSSIKIVTMRQLRHTQNTNLVRSQRLSNARRGQHLDGWPSENLLFFQFFKLFMFDSFPKSCPQFF